jgi:hypothetical protein
MCSKKPILTDSWQSATLSSANRGCISEEQIQLFRGALLRFAAHKVSKHCKIQGYDGTDPIHPRK